MQQQVFTRRYKIANLANILIFIAIVSTVSVLYGKTIGLQFQAEATRDDRSRLSQHEQDLSGAQRTIERLTVELESLRQEIAAQRSANSRLEEDLRRAVDRLEKLSSKDGK